MYRYGRGRDRPASPDSSMRSASGRDLSGLRAVAGGSGGLLVSPHVHLLRGERCFGPVEAGGAEEAVRCEDHADTVTDLEIGELDRGLVLAADVDGRARRLDRHRLIREDGVVRSR